MYLHPSGNFSSSCNVILIYPQLRSVKFSTANEWLEDSYHHYFVLKSKQFLGVILIVRENILQK